MDWTAFGDGIGAHRPSAAGNRYDQPDLVQQDQRQNLRAEEPSPDSTDEKSLELPQADETSP
ncbi:uncharacterized protein BJ212DRAFT_1401724 [Suillus subaureus]|uniref:Uncharacterized protein n=1 Tax=Suillus subaureus TaxID=48587 RepID=A0A9P7J2I6_9AGAM|nr:uncharacterized protein BJ212DRAFT_1401724 [Suillus subaureus]KAG1799603.1 hypothetical protein BJ212DRAFT_1401724 [Suillus subaureus]